MRRSLALMTALWCSQGVFAQNFAPPIQTFGGPTPQAQPISNFPVVQTGGPTLSPQALLPQPATLVPQPLPTSQFAPTLQPQAQPGFAVSNGVQPTSFPPQVQVQVQPGSLLSPTGQPNFAPSPVVQQTNYPPQSQPVPNSPASFASAQSANSGPSQPGPGVDVNKESGLLNFPSEQVEVQWVDGKWMLVAGNYILKDFGKNQQDAQDAARLVRELKLTQLGAIGAPKPVLEFWLSSGQAPVTDAKHLRTIALETDSLRVERFEQHWLLRNKSRSLFAFAHREEADQALQLIQQFGFTHLVTLGRGAPTMHLFVQKSDVLTVNKVAVTPSTLLIPKTPGGDRESITPAPLTAGRMPSPEPIQARRPLQPTTGGEPIQGNFPPSLQTVTNPNLQPVPTTANQQLQAADTLPTSPRQLEIVPSRGASTPRELEIVPSRGTRQGVTELERTSFQQNTPTQPGASGLGTSRGNTSLSDTSSLVERLPIDYQGVHVRKDSSGWNLMYRNRVLASFQQAEADAKSALALFQQCRFNEQVRVGKSHGNFSCYLTDGKVALEASPEKVQTLGFDASMLVVKRNAKGYALYADGEKLAQFGENGQEAWQALALLQKLRLNCRCQVGSETSNWTFFVKR